MKTHSCPAVFAGQSYPADPGQLLSEFHRLLHRQPVPKASSGFLIVPHIDIRVDAEIHARTYARMRGRKKFPSVVYILGVGHQCPHEFSACACTYTTPLGPVLPACPSLQSIQDLCNTPIARSPATFHGEHSIEFAVIWLQALRDLYFPGQEFRIVPVLLGGLFETMRSGRLPDRDHEITRFGAALASVFRDEPDALLLASIDGCHVGPRFGHSFPALPPVQKAVQRWERELWKLCRSDRLADFISHLSAVENGFYFDGTGALTLLLRNFHLTAVRSSHNLWYEEGDHSFVTFSSGYFKHQ